MHRRQGIHCFRSARSCSQRETLRDSEPMPGLICTQAFDRPGTECPCLARCRASLAERLPLGEFPEIAGSPPAPVPPSAVRELDLNGRNPEEIDGPIPVGTTWPDVSRRNGSPHRLDSGHRRIRQRGEIHDCVVDRLLTAVANPDLPSASISPRFDPDEDAARRRLILDLSNPPPLCNLTPQQRYGNQQRSNRADGSKPGRYVSPFDAKSHVANLAARPCEWSRSERSLLPMRPTFAPMSSLAPRRLQRSNARVGQ